MIGFKSKCWSYEKEIRVVCTQPKSQSHDYRAVKSIYFGLRMSDQDKATLMSCLKGRGISYYQMQLRENSYALTAVEIRDSFADAPKYISVLAPIRNYAIDSEENMNEKWKPFADYLPKVAAIARRMPWTEMVETVGVSPNRSTETEPMFFALCMYKDRQGGKSVYFTLSEVDEEYAAIAGK